MPKSEAKPVWFRFGEDIMTRLLAALGLILLSSQAFAIERYTSTGMSCDEVHQRIESAGAAIMRHNSTRVANLTLFGRYVRDGQFCKRGEALERVYIPAADTPSCPVLECKQIDYDDPFFLRPD